MENENVVEIDLRKALDTSGTGGSGAELLIPERISEGLRRYVEYASPLYDMLPKKDWATDVYRFRSQTGRSSAAFTAEGAVASESNPTFAKPSVDMKWITSKGAVTGPMLAIARKTGRDMIDVWQEQVQDHADALVRKLERTIVAGDDSVDALEFDGLKVQITQQHDNADAVLTLSALDTMLDIPAEYPSLMVMSRAMGRRIWSLLQAQQRFIDRTEVRAGLRVPTYNDLPILRVDTEADADLDDVILAPDLRHVLMPTLQDITFEMLGRVDDTEAFFIKMYTTLAVEGASRYHVKMVNVAASA